MSEGSNNRSSPVVVAAANGQSTTGAGAATKAPAAFAVDRELFKRGKAKNGTALRVCILEIAKGHTLEVTHAAALDPNATANGSTTPTKKTDSKDAPPPVVYDHDTEETLKVSRSFGFGLVCDNQKKNSTPLQHAPQPVIIVLF